ncbi:MAG TPA: biotin carboxylase N-terminal domain-containing protein [Gaiellaceae bacterium]
MTIRKLLVANRGEIARRIFRTCRALGISTVAVYAEPDAAAPFVHEADEAVAIDGYLRDEAIVAAAARTGADAIHPGYGFLAESPAFARRCRDAGIVWIGPAAETIEAVGDKVAAKELAARVGVPVLPSEGFPLLVKAAAGGGGRGMRVVRDERELSAAVAAAEREASSSFGDGRVFRERLVEGARHVEVQVLGDAHGHVVHLFGRECSVQRRWQKVIEEAPVVDERLHEAAVALAREIGYVGAGTIEFLLAPDGAFFFLEANARLQVEHPVTEEVTGLDLVSLQIRIAEGEPLDVAPAATGHAIEARLYAEDPALGYLPSTGRIARFEIDGVRVDSGVEVGSVVTSHYDPLLAKLVAHAPTRVEAIRKLAGALRRARVHGVTTNRDQLLAVLTHPAFAAGEIDTTFLDRVQIPRVDARLHAAAAALAAQAARRRGHTLPSGWRNNPSQRQRTAYEGYDVDYRLAREGLELEVNGERIDALLVSCTPGVVELEVDGVRRRFEVSRADGVAWVDSSLGSARLRELPRFREADLLEAEGSLVAPMPGTVVRVDAEPGEEVEAGQTLVVVEAMKMEHVIAAPHAARVAEVRVAAGEQVDGGRVLVVLEEVR